MSKMTEKSGDFRVEMENFWEEYATNADVTEMMLDTDAEQTCDMEYEEIVASLPEYCGKDVLELGAGIGRFTGTLSESANSVIAVDFVEKFLRKNKETNSNRKNITFLCENVMSLHLPDDSVDFIFTNCLLMFLSDSDSELLISNMLQWLKPNGRLFIRESCHRPCGDMVQSLSHNPSIYRSPNQYTNLITSPDLKKSNGKTYGFDVITSKSVQVYVKVRNNADQICWLLELSERDREQNQGYETFQKFLDNHQYYRAGIYKYEEVFGKDYVSPGGHETTKQVCGMLNLKKGQKVLDVGCGIGGSAFHMAREYGAEVFGIDLSENMISIANERNKEYKVPMVSFEVADATKVSFADQSFDVIYSRDALLHIERKDLLLRKFYTWLKPGGRILFTDYVCGPHESHSEEFKAYIAYFSYHLLTVEQYRQMIEEAGFQNINAIDKTEEFVETMQKELVSLEKKKNDFIKKYSPKNFQSIIDIWNSKLKRCAQGEQKWGLFYAKKGEQ